MKIILFPGQQSKKQNIRTMKLVKAPPDDPIYQTGLLIGRGKCPSEDINADCEFIDELAQRRVARELSIQALAGFLDQARELFDIDMEVNSGALSGAPEEYSDED